MTDVILSKYTIFATVDGISMSYVIEARNYDEAVAQVIDILKEQYPNGTFQGDLDGSNITVKLPDTYILIEGDNND